MRVLPTIRRRRFLLLSVIVLSVIVFLFPNVSAFHIIIDSNQTPGLTPILFDLGENIVTSATFTATTTTIGHAEIRLLEEVSRAIVDSCVGSEVSLAAGDSTSLSCTCPNNVDVGC